MIYFLVNNNYQFIDVLAHCKYLEKFEKTLIQVPHTLDVINNHKDFSDIHTFMSPFMRKKDYFNFFKLKNNINKIEKSLVINKNDILFLYTEFEILNQVIISFFKKNGGRVFIIEDGGFPTYLTYSVKSNIGIPFKTSLRFLYLKYVLGFNFLKYLYYNGLVFPQVNEKYIDGVFLYRDVQISRNIKKNLISKNLESTIFNKKNCIFLNEKVYYYYCSKEEYKEILFDILTKLSKKFEKIYFKFHPKETDSDMKWQLEIINSYHNIILINEKTPIELLLKKYDSKYIFSYLCAALLNIDFLGATPIYIYHLYSRLNKNPVFNDINLILNNLNYNFIKDDFNLEGIGFSEKKIEQKMLLRDYILKIAEQI